MRCDDLTRELASPTGALSSAEMAGHIAACPACAERSRAASRFDRIWEATRPAEPSMDALDALWARASVEIDARTLAPATLRFERPARRLWATVGIRFAQAAAILIVASLVLLRLDPGKPVEVAVNKPADEASGPKPTQVAVVSEPVFLELNVDFDMQPVVHLDKRNQPRVEKHAASYVASSSLPANTWHDEVAQMEAADSSFGTVASTQW